MSIPSEDEVNELEEAFKLETIRVNVEMNGRVYGYTHAVPAGWPELRADPDADVLATATQISLATASKIAGVIIQAIVQEHAPHLIPEGEKLIPVKDIAPEPEGPRE